MDAITLYNSCLDVYFTDLEEYLFDITGIPKRDGYEVDLLTKIDSCIVVHVSNEMALMLSRIRVHQGHLEFKFEMENGWMRLGILDINLAHMIAMELENIIKKHGTIDTVKRIADTCSQREGREAEV